LASQFKKILALKNLINLIIAGIFKFSEPLINLKGKMTKIDLIVTRHPGLVEYLIEEGIVNSSTPVVTHASVEDLKGKHIVGVLPNHLSCHTTCMTEIPLDLPVELRGKKLTVEDVRKYARPAVTYVIRTVADFENGHRESLEMGRQGY